MPAHSGLTDDQLNEAMRWITGGFRTTPVGALEALGGVMPIGLYVQKLHKRYMVRIRTLPCYHPVVALFPNTLGCSEMAPFSRFLPELVAPVHSLPLSGAPQVFGSITESFDSLDEECRPGRRLVDTHGDRIEYLLDHPKKDTDEIASWIANTLLPRIQQCRDDPDTVYIFTDGSAHPTQGKSAAGYHAYYGYRQIRSHMASTGRALSYDAELFALGMALTYACGLGFNIIHIFSDGESAIKTVLETHLHAGHDVSVNACKYVRAWLDGDVRRRLTFSHCPSHSGVELNERIDRAVGRAACDPAIATPQPCPMSLTYQRYKVTADMWHTIARGPKYWGRRFPLHPGLRMVTHTGGYAVKRVGDSNSLCARLGRCLTDHSPIGAYRLRFFSDQPTACTCEHPELQTRRHIFDRCTHYPRPAHHARWDDYMDELDPFPLIIRFLEKYPTVFTFEDALPTGV